MKRFFYFLLGLMAIQTAKAQYYQCVDSTRVNPYYYCSYEFHPVCGCNNVTYISPCVAASRNGVMIYNEGVCKDFIFDFYPTLVGAGIYSGVNFYLQFKDKGDVNITIMDLYGTIYFQRLRSGVALYQEQFDLSFLKDGIYFLVVRSGSIQQVKKFIKIVYQ